MYYLAFLGLIAGSALGNVFGQDDRKVIESQQYPYTAIGYFDSGCTGTLIGPSLVLTAAHCVLNEKTGQLRERLTFFPNRIQGQSKTYSAAVRAWFGTKNPAGVRHQDWAIVEIEHQLGLVFGYLGVFFLQNKQINSAGYSKDINGAKSLSVHFGCNIVSENEQGYWEHDCDYSGGASGGPIFLRTEGDKYWVIGVNVSERRGTNKGTVYLPEFEMRYANLAVKSVAFKETYQAILKKLKGESP